MEKIYVVKVQGWEDETISFSYHRTTAGAEKAAAEAMAKYDTKMAWVEEIKVKE